MDWGLGFRMGILESLTDVQALFVGFTFCMRDKKFKEHGVLPKMSARSILGCRASADSFLQQLTVSTQLYIYIYTCIYSFLSHIYVYLYENQLQQQAQV